MYMKKIGLLLLGILSGWTLYAEPTIIKPSVKTPTSFALFLDRTSYEKCREAVEDYRHAVEADGLGTYIIYDDWQSPEAVRTIILELAAGKMPLEGVAFAGEIPIVMTRDAQHLSSAFKMNQQADWKRSSIPSDRYYDDFDLRFEFVKRDEEKPLYFYYSLAADSEQYLESDIYSARIRPIVREGTDQYESLSAYFRKAAAAHRTSERLDDIFVFCGHGYNSESYASWSGEQIALHEQLPSMTRPGHRIFGTTFEDRYPMKYYVLQYLQDGAVDVALLHHHGSSDMQYINGSEKVSSPRMSIAAVQRYLRGKVRDSEHPEKTVEEYAASLDVPHNWFADTEETRIADSLYNRDMDIYIDDVYKAQPNARFVMFDACYNGSFHLDEYIAGAYLFNSGRTVATMGNSVNSLQDKWPDRYLGLLACGVRLGTWARHTYYLESHLIGDPTLRFEDAESCSGLNEALILYKSDDGYWLDMLKKTDLPDLQSIALRKLNANHYAHIADLLYETFISSRYGVVRMECLELMSRKGGPRFKTMVASALNDDYELVRRFAAQYLGMCGDDSLIVPAVESLLKDVLSTRVAYHVTDVLSFFDPDKLKAEIERRYAETPTAAYGARNKQALFERLARTQENVTNNMRDIFDESKPLKRRISNVQNYRNYHYHYMVPRLLELASDTTQPEELRIATVEALGWFRLSYRCSEIAECCLQLQKNDSSAAVRNEALKTLKRLDSDEVTGRND